MLEVHMVPVTNGDSTLLRLRDGKENATILFDGGLSRHECVSYLQSLKVDKLDIVVASHFHWDHVGGLESIRNAFPVDEYWTGDLRPFEEYCRALSPSPYVLACLTMADRPLRSGNGKNRLVWDGVQKSFCRDRLTLQVLAPPYDLWRRLRRPGVAAGLLQPDQERAYRKRLLGYPEERLDVKDEGEEERPKPEEDWEIAQPIGPKYLAEAVTEESIPQDKEPEIARFLSSAISPWNDMSIVVKVIYQSNVGPISILFPGDLANWSYVYTYHEVDARCDLLKVAHHCSDTYIDRDDIDNFVNGEWRFLMNGLEQHGQSWLDKQLRTRAKNKKFPYYEWHELGLLPSIFLPPFIAAMAAHTSVTRLPSDIIDWLRPTEAFYFPFRHGNFELPASNKRESIRSRVEHLYCTRDPCNIAKATGLAMSCQAHSGCKMRQTPNVFQWD